MFFDLYRTSRTEFLNRVPLQSSHTQFHIGQKLHLHNHGSAALAGWAAPGLQVERKMAGTESAAAGVAGFGENFADVVKGLRVCCRIRPRRPADRGLVHEDHVGNMLGILELRRTLRAVL